MPNDRTRRAVLGTGADDTGRGGIADVGLPGMPGDGDGGIEPAVEGEVATGGPATQSLIEWMAAHIERDDTDEWAAMERSIARIMAGENAEDVLREDSPLKGEDIAGRPFTLHGFTLTQSDFSEGSPVYATLDAEFPGNGRRHVVNIGGMKVLAKLMMLDRIGEWPQFVMITSKTTKSGNRVHDLIRA